MSPIGDIGKEHVPCNLLVTFLDVTDHTHRSRNRLFHPLWGRRKTGRFFQLRGLDGKAGHLAFVQQFVNVFAPHIFEVNHRRLEIAVPEPLLQRADAQAVFQTRGGVGMPELVQVPLAAVRTLRTLVAVPGDAVPAIESVAPGNAFEASLEFPVWPPPSGGKDQVVRIGTRLAGLVFLEQSQERCGNRDLAFFFVLGLKPKLLFGGDADALAGKIDIAPGGMAHLLVALPAKQEEQITNLFLRLANPEQRLQIARFVHLANVLDVLGLVALEQQALDAVALQQLQDDAYAVVDGTCLIALGIYVPHCPGHRGSA